MHKRAWEIVYSANGKGNHMSANVLSMGKCTELCYEQTLMLNGNEHRTVGTVKLGLEQLQEEKH